jgi:hypothetical protein
MLTINQRKNIESMDYIDTKQRATVRSRVTNKTIKCIDDITLVFENADKFPHLKNKVDPESIQRLSDAYFEAYKVSISFSNPKRVINLIDENAKLKRKNAALMQELGDLTHRVEHFKYMASHAAMLLKKQK